MNYVIAYHIILFYITLYYIILYYIILYNIVLHYIILYYAISYVIDFILCLTLVYEVLVSRRILYETRIVGNRKHFTDLSPNNH